MEQTCSELDRRFGIAGVARVQEGHGGLLKVRITSPDAVAEMYLHGGHVVSWIPPTAEDVFFVSRQTRWERGRAIRGGVPVCFPWFGNHLENRDAPAHGFVRTRPWELESVVQENGAVAVSMFTESDDETKRWWPADFRLVHRAKFGSTLSLELIVTNTGTMPIRFEEALHSYHRVGSVGEVQVRGLDAVNYRDKTDSNREKTQHGDMTFVSETDRAFLNTIGPIDVIDPVLGRRIRVTKEHSRTTVVWNPWTDKSRALPDLADEEWTHFVCVETSNIGPSAVHLAPGQQHTMKALVTLAAL